MIELTAEARECIVALFSGGDVAEAEQLLERCADSPPLIDEVKRQGADRMLFSLIRLSGALLGLEPEPRYLVDFGDGDEGEIYQRVLARRAG
jgi:hypothetical protein